MKPYTHTVTPRFVSSARSIHVHAKCAGESESRTDDGGAADRDGVDGRSAPSGGSIRVLQRLEEEREVCDVSGMASRLQEAE
jgi:hypothetical protein